MKKFQLKIEKYLHIINSNFMQQEKKKVKRNSSAKITNEDLEKK